MRAGDSQQGPGPPPGEPLPLRLALSAGGGLVAPTPSTISPLLALDVALGLGERWRLGLMAAFSFGGAVDITDEAGRTRGRLSSRDVTVLGEGLVCTSGRLSLCGGLRAGVRLGIGSASGPFIFQTRTAFAVTPALGPAGRLTARFGRFFLTADVTGLVNLTTPALTVEGLPTTIPTPRLEALGWLGAGLEGP